MTDLVPAMPSRLVTIDVVDLGETTRPALAQVRFSLPCDLHVPDGDQIIAAGTQVVDLVNGVGQVLLPVYDPSVARDQHGSEDWAIVVSKSWHGPDHDYAIRVPAGVGSVSLADLPAVRPLTARERQYAITAVSLTVQTGATPAGTASLTGGVLSLGVTIPNVVAPTLRLLGTKPDTGALPSSGNTQGDGWLVSGELHMWSGTDWVNAGPFPAPAGARGWFNVRDYGAVGDGVADDTAAIQSCITAAGANSTIFWPAGKYLVTSKLTMTSDTQWVGVGIDDRNTVAGISAMSSYIVTDVPGSEAVDCPYNTSLQGLVFISATNGVGTGLRFSGQVQCDNIAVRGYNVGISLFNLYYGSLRTIRTIHNVTAITLSGVHNTTLIDARISAQQLNGKPGVGIVGASSSELTMIGGGIENHSVGVQMVAGFSLTMIGTYFESSPPDKDYGVDGGAKHVLARDVGKCVVNALGVTSYANNAVHFIDASGATAAAVLNVQGTTHRGAENVVRYIAHRWFNASAVRTWLSGDSWHVTGTDSSGNAHLWLTSTVKAQGASMVIPPTGAGGKSPGIYTGLPITVET